MPTARKRPFSPAKVNGPGGHRNGLPMNESPSYPDLDDAWFLGSTTEAPANDAPPRLGLRRADVLAAYEQHKSQPPDAIDPAGTEAGLDDSWFDRPARFRR